MNGKYKYNAFISYRHTEPDKTIAAKLQKMLESYTPPKSITGPGFRRWHVFRDETELPTSSNLSEDIRAALEASEFLIVICSGSTAQSKWCMEEIAYFKELHNGSNSNIITLVADGEPSEVFPYELCNELIPVTDADGNVTYQSHEIEPLAANVAAPTLKQSEKKLKTEFLRIAAPLLSCGYDNLYNRSQRRRTRRAISISAAVAAAFTAFGLYSGAMTLRINAQNVALQAANESLNERTRELQLANEELERKTIEAENNLAEANRQRDIAEANLAEANRQKGLAETNLTEANHQRGLAETNLAEANRQRGLAETNLAEANRQRKNAEDNLAEANLQRKNAEDNLAEANLQRKNAENNLTEANLQRKNAEDNLAEANRQKQIAEENASEAELQRGIAEENMLVAQANEAKANEANRSLRISNSEILASQAKMYHDRDDAFSAINAALAALPQSADDDLPFNINAEKVLADATGAYNGDSFMLCNPVSLSSYVNYLEFSADGSRVLAKDKNGTIYVIDYDNNRIIKSFSAYETFGATSATSIDLIVDDNTAYALYDGRLMSIDLKTADVNWSYDTGNWERNIVTNESSDLIFLAGSSSYSVLTKSGELIISSGSKYDYDSETDEYYNPTYYSSYYMDSDSNIYVVTPDQGQIYILNPLNGTKTILELDATDNYILSIGEGPDRVYINQATSYNAAKLICLDKNDFSVNWSTEYGFESRFLRPNYLNKVFELFHRLIDDNGEGYDKDGVIVVSEDCITAFDRETGEQYFQYENGGDEPFLYCEPNDGYSIRAATPHAVYTELYLMNGSPEGMYYTDNIHSFSVSFTLSEDLAYIGWADNYHFALASEDSSEVSLYHMIPQKNQVLLEQFPNDLIFTKSVDNGNGIFAALDYSYADGTREYQLLIYDVANNRLLSSTQLDFLNIVEELAYVTENRLFIRDYDGNAKILDNYGNVLSEFNLIDTFRAVTGMSADEKVYTIYDSSSYVYNNSLFFFLSRGILRIDFTNDDFTPSMILSIGGYGSLSAPYMSDDLVCYIASSYPYYRIAYFKGGDTELSYVKDNGEEISFAYGVITSLTNSGNGHTIAFINQEGYIGLYKYGDDNIRKIHFSVNDAVPQKIYFTPDSKYIIAKCANGEFIKYSVESLEKAASYQPGFTVDSYSNLDFIDDDTFIVTSGGISTAYYIIDADSLSLKAEIQNIVHFMKSDKKILTRSYMSKNEAYAYGYYNYLTGMDMIEFAKDFLAENF
ncbi:MAG: TIR domain-containing protein [Oscillospiraceae bacterium]|nr:TIR domain-containing protein [Oscillospiraceae bacterium]